jgi:PAS domain S-box-containing protein
MLMRVSTLMERGFIESEECFRALMHQSVSAIYVWQDGRIVYANPHMREIFGYTPDEPIESDPLAYVAERDWPKVGEKTRQLLAAGGETVYSTTAIRKDRSEFALRVHAKVASCNGATAIIATARDISAKLCAEEDARRHLEELKRALNGTIQVVSLMGEARDPYTHGHERRVGELAAAIGIEMGLDANRVEGIRVAGYLHDVGKIAIPAEILSKPSRLTPTEFALIKGHARQSHEILKGVNFPWPVAQVALQHHERLDGSGYPEGLKGDQIILEARIMAVADVVEAMSSHRPYRPGLGIGKALAEIHRGRETAYDPPVADACLRLFTQDGYSIPA